MIKTLKSKLTLPRLPSTIKRERLFSLLENIPNQKITTIVAGAGYGKTTLAAQLVNLLGFRYLWYRLDRSDMDFFTFLTYLITGFQKYYSELGSETFARIQQTRSINQEWRSILTVFLSELDQFLADDFVVVIDDYHLIQESPEITELTEFLLARQNPLIHLIIISRTEPQIPLSRYRATRELAEIKESDLCFTPPEIKLIFNRLFKLPLEDKSLEILMEKTGGWISGLILFYHTLKGKKQDEIREVLMHSTGTSKIIASYLEENVLAQQPENIKDFLQKTSFFPRIEVAFCNEALTISDAADILEYLESNHLFAFPVDENRSIYYYHHLFQDFLRKRFTANTDETSYKKFHKKTAGLYQSKGMRENALRHFLFAESHKECCLILNQIGGELLKAGKFRQLASYLAAIPKQFVDQEPWLLYSQARILDLSGQPKPAIKYYKKALRKFSELKIRKGEGLCLNALGNNYFQTGDFYRAEKKLEEVLVLFEENKRVTLNILTHLIFISSHLGKMEKADNYFERGIAIAKNCNERGLLESLYLNQGFRYGCAGDFEKAQELACKAHEGFKDEELQHLLAFNYHLKSWVNYYLGDYEKGHQNAHEGLKITRKLGFLDASHAWLLMDVALNATTMGKIQEAIEYASESLNAFKSMENRWGQSYSLHILQLAYMAKRDYTKARHAGKAALEIIEGLRLPFEEGLFSSHLANLYLETENLEPVRPLLEKAGKLVQSSNFFCFQIELWLAKYYFKTGDPDQATQKLKECLLKSRSKKHECCLLQEGEWLYSLLSEMYEDGHFQTQIERLVAKSTFSLHPFSATAKKELPPVSSSITNLQTRDLSIRCLGEFSVWVGDTELPANCWSSRKAKLLLKYLVQVRSDGYTEKEQLIEFLWPESPFSKASHRLQVTLSTLRKILGSAHPQKGASNQYIKRDGNAYRLDPGDNGFVDCDQFIKEIKLADKTSGEGILRWQNAEALYRGDYMKDEPYVDAFESKREFYREKYLQILQKLVDHFDELSDYERCIQYVEKSLSTDPYNEAQYCALMKYHSVSGNKRKINQTYQNCIKHLKSGLDITPTPETTTLHQRLMR